MKKALSIIAIFLFCASCSQKKTPEGISVVTTIFPLYDFARQIGGSKINVTLLLPPGAEAHSYEPTPADMVMLSKASLFIYTGDEMEPWAGEVIRSLPDSKVKVLNASKGIPLIRDEDHNDDHDAEHEKDHHHHEFDPHVWLDFGIDLQIVDSVLAMLDSIDPANRDYYAANAAAYKQKLVNLDSQYRTVLSKCRVKTILYGGHFAFGYMVKRYNLSHQSPYSGYSSNVEPSPRNISELSQKVKTLGVKYIFHEELADPKVARVIADETGCKILLLHAAHNISKKEIEDKVTFIDIMKGNLERLQKGLDYRE